MRCYYFQDKENEEIDEVDVETDLEEKDPDVDKTASTSSIFGNNQFLAGKLHS